VDLTLKKLLTDKKKRQLLQDIESHYKAMWVKDIFPRPWSIIHGVQHSEYVIRTLERLLEAYMSTRYGLNQSEILVLLGSAWLHDIGYLPQEKETEYDFDVVRANHPIKGYDYVMNNLSLCGGTHYGPLIALCVRGHREVPIKGGKYVDRVVKSEKVRLQFLTALLRLADELDLGEERAPRPFLNQLRTYCDELPEHTLLQWIRHFYTEGIELRHSVKDGVDLHITIHAYVPSEEYKDYVVVPWIVEPIKTAVLDTYYALSREHLVIDTNIDSHITLVSIKEPIPRTLFSHLQRQVLNRESLRSLMRYDYQRSIAFLGKIGRKDPIFKSEIIEAKNSLEYTLVNNSDDKKWISGNGAFLNVTTDFLETLPKQPLGKNMVAKRIGFEMYMTRGGMTRKTRVKYLELASLSYRLGNMSVTDLREKLKRFKPFEKKIFAFYEIRGDERPKTMLCRYSYLEPIQPNEAVRLNFSWNSMYLPWDIISSTLRLPTKGITISFVNFPDTYRFRTTTTLLKEFGTKEGQGRGPEFSILFGDIAKKIVDSSLIAPGSQVVTQWRDVSQKGQGSLGSEIA